MEGLRTAGEVFPPFGRDLRGRLTYDEAGFVALQMAKSGRARFASEDLEAGTSEEVKHAFDGYHAWFGRFTVSADETTVVHRIEASLFPNWEGVDQTRSVTLTGDDLILRSRPLPYGGDLVAFATRWIRVK
jgi:hypothetical protein